MKNTIALLVTIFTMFGIGFFVGRVRILDIYSPNIHDIPVVTFVIPSPAHDHDTDSSALDVAHGPMEFSIPQCEALKLKWTFGEGRGYPPDILCISPGGYVYLPNDINEVILNEHSICEYGPLHIPRDHFRGFEKGKVYHINIGTEIPSRRQTLGSSMAVQAQIILKVTQGENHGVRIPRKAGNIGDVSRHSTNQLRDE